jgi:inner membrane protein
MTSNILDKIRASVLFKIFFIGILILVLLIPLVMVESLIHERQKRRDDAFHEVSDKWGRSQVLNGPVLVIPYREYVTGKDKKKYEKIFQTYFLPDSLSFQGNMKSEVRKRGIFDIPLYNLELKVKARFKNISFETLKIPSRDILWDDAFLMIGIPDTRGIKEQARLIWKKNSQIQKMEFLPSPKSFELFSSGIHALLPQFKAASGANNTFEFDLNLRGSDTLSFVPLGKDTIVSLNADWKDPSFFGNYLPSEHRIKADSFQALWKVAYFGRNYPQSWLGKEANHSSSLQSSAFGVKLFMAVDVYQKSARAVKYGSLFIFLTFLGVFLFEVIARIRIHPIQYLLVGFGMVLFYLLLISLSEHLFFVLSYLVGSAAVIALLTYYCIKIMQKKIRGMIMGAILLVLYIYLYILLVNQDYSLLIGSLGLFLILAFVMFLTRNIDWYAIGRDGDKSL